MNLSNSFSDPNGYFTYVCLVSDVRPCGNSKEGSMNRGCTISSHAISTSTDELGDDQPIQVERSKAVHELVESKRNNMRTTKGVLSQEKISSTEDTKLFNNNLNTDGASKNILKLTKMQWLTENREEMTNSSSSSPTVSLTNSNSSVCSRESDENINQCMSSGEKCLSTILRLDREHNMFGMSNITIVGRKMSKKNRKDNEKPAFPQTAIIQICCAKSCCRHKSNTDLPASLRCSSCHSCYDPFCARCVGYCGPPCAGPPCPRICSPCPPKTKFKCKTKLPCPVTKCMLECNPSFGLKVSLKKKDVFEPSPIEVTPRSSCVLLKPQCARPCNHIPRCLPPSSCFPYLMPCYWPARSGAPCSHPAQCFHNPPCRPPRIRRSPVPVDETCPKDKKCIDEANKTKCPNPTCPGDDKSCTTDISNNKYKGNIQICNLCGTQLEKKSCTCTENSPSCTNCFVKRPQVDKFQLIEFHSENDYKE